jgi:hypothetical protein
MEDQNPYNLKLLQKTQKKGNKTNSKIPKKYPQKTLEISHYGHQFCCGWEILLRTSIKGSVMHAEMT